MLTVDTFIGIIGLCIASFSLGYMLGQKKQK